MKELSSYAVVVYVDSATKDKVPAHATTAMFAKGNHIPMIAVTSPDTSETYFGTGYDEIKGKDSRKVYREGEKTAKAKLVEFFAKGPSATTGATAGGTTDPAKPTESGTKPADAGAGVFRSETWSDASGRSMEATFVAVEGENLKLKKADGKTFSLPLSKFSAASQARAKELAGTESR
jgi:hypothetical protein